MKFFSWNVMDCVQEAIHAKLKSEDTWQQIVDLFGAEKRNEWLVVCFNSNGLAQDVVSEFFSGPGKCQCLFLYLCVPLFSFRHCS